MNRVSKLDTASTYKEFFEYIRTRNTSELGWLGIDVIYLTVNNHYLDTPTAAQVLVNGIEAFTVAESEWDTPMRAYDICSLAKTAFTRGYDIGYSKAQTEEE